MALRPCLKCGRLTPRGSYCPGCKPRRLRGRTGVELRETVRRIHGHRCQDCGATGVPLDVHHRDGDPANNALSNLEPLCRSCHAKVSQRG
jgi:5-methylcytosine-specific restriction endonuclease McrA